jgi:hypothetical protein
MKAHNMCSLSLDAKQLAFSARPTFQEVVVWGLTGRTGRWGCFVVATGRCSWVEDAARERAVTHVFTPHME